MKFTGDYSIQCKGLEIKSVCSEHTRWSLIVFFPIIKGLLYVVDLLRDLFNALSQTEKVCND